MKLALSKKIREQVYNKFNGHCAYCGKEIGIKEMQVDHIIPQSRKHIIDNINLKIKDKKSPPYLYYLEEYDFIPKDINDIENLNPACRRCNHYKRAETVRSFRQTMLTIHERIRQNYINKVAEDYGIITIKPFDGKFYFEKLNETF